ncbi:hypothetical protein ACFVT2_36310 [Streptomyces sp. NPDC058000]|uniref:hypothetical protein n=1 Tax=Streptomyces sp. NPDC058000 TaxID=3346299 RepID=UPI0036E5C355
MPTTGGSIRIDLSRAAGTDFEGVLLTVRLALAGAVGRPLPAFDLALRRYWDHNHPGEPLEEYLRRTGLTGRFAQALPEHLQATISDVVSALELPGMVGATVSQITGSLVRALRERRQTVRALAGQDQPAAGRRHAEGPDADRQREVGSAPADLVGPPGIRRL